MGIDKAGWAVNKGKSAEYKNAMVTAGNIKHPGTVDLSRPSYSGSSPTVAYFRSRRAIAQNG
jgi:hypothetical protein